MSVTRLQPICLLPVVCVCFLFSIGPQAQAQFSFEKNSLQKLRVAPGAQASRIGSAVNWLPNFESAVTESRATGKPIFWYVPTLRGSFMDRQTEIDRYMLGGPFSWPDIISVLNEHYVPLKATPNRQQQKRFGLVPYVFVEPGFLILNPAGEEQLKLDRLTTLHPRWFRQLLVQPIPQAIRTVTTRPPGLGAECV